MGNAVTKTPREKAETLIDDALSKHRVVVFSKPQCGYCTAAKRVLRTEIARVAGTGCAAPRAEVIELDDGDVAREVQLVLAERTGAATVPRVFVGGGCVGGAEETVAYARSGGLRIALMDVAGCAAPDE